MAQAQIRETAWFPSEIDLWLGILLALLPVLMTTTTIRVARDDPANVVAILPGLLVLALVYGGLLFPMRYGMDGEHLVIRHGLMRQKVKLSQITSVRPSRSILSSPALSMNRLRVRYGSGTFRAVLISPAERSRFLDLLAERAGLVREGSVLTRAEPGVAAESGSL